MFGSIEESDDFARDSLFRSRLHLSLIISYAAVPMHALWSAVHERGEVVASPPSAPPPTSSASHASPPCHSLERRPAPPCLRTAPRPPYGFHQRRRTAPPTRHTRSPRLAHLERVDARQLDRRGAGGAATESRLPLQGLRRGVGLHESRCARCREAQCASSCSRPPLSTSRHLQTPR